MAFNRGFITSRQTWPRQIIVPAFLFSRGLLPDCRLLPVPVMAIGFYSCGTASWLRCRIRARYLIFASPGIITLLSLSVKVSFAGMPARSRQRRCYQEPSNEDAISRKVSRTSTFPHVRAWRRHRAAIPAPTVLAVRHADKRSRKLAFR